MDLGLTDKVAVVLASSKGMGRASAELLAREGCRLAICARTRKDIEKAAREIREATGRPVLAEAIDVEDRAAMKRFLDAVLGEYGGVDILVTNCGGPPPGPPLEFTDEDWDAAVTSTLMVAVNWARAVAPVMKKRGWGRILNITSVAVKQPIDGLILSNTMRAGVIGFAKSMSRELASHGITVNNLCPGMILTDRLRALAERRAKDGKTTIDEVFRRMAADIPIGRVGTPEEFAAAVAFLAGEPARYITGATIQVDGGVVRGLL